MGGGTMKRLVSEQMANPNSTVREGVSRACVHMGKAKLKRNLNCSFRAWSSTNSLALLLMQPRCTPTGRQLPGQSSSLTPWRTCTQPTPWSYTGGGPSRLKHSVLPCAQQLWLPSPALACTTPTPPNVGLSGSFPSSLSTSFLIPSFPLSFLVPSLPSHFQEDKNKTPARRDLKLENILFTSPSKEGDRVAKLAGGFWFGGVAWGWHGVLLLRACAPVPRQTCGLV